MLNEHPVLKSLRRAFPNGPWHLAAFSADGSVICSRTFGPASADAALAFYKLYHGLGLDVGCRVEGTTQEMVEQAKRGTGNNPMCLRAVPKHNPDTIQ